MKKSELRTIYKTQRNALTVQEVSDLSEKIFENFLKNFSLKVGQNVHCFLSMPKRNEVDTSAFINYFLENGLNVFVPKIVSGKLIAVPLQKNTPLLMNSWGILEPESNIDAEIHHFDYILTPLLYADFKGNRVGYGKGFYDGLFSEIDEKSVKVGLNFFDADVLIDDVWQDDVPLDYLVTPTAVLSFTGESKVIK